MYWYTPPLRTVAENIQAFSGGFIQADPEHRSFFFPAL